MSACLEHSEDLLRPLLGVEVDLGSRGVELVLEPVGGAHGRGQAGRLGKDVGVVVAVRLKQDGKPVKQLNKNFQCFE